MLEVLQHKLQISYVQLMSYNIRNSLPDSVVDANTINIFKSRLDKHWLDQDVLYNFHSEFRGSRVILGFTGMSKSTKWLKQPYNRYLMLETM